MSRKIDGIHIELRTGQRNTELVHDLFAGVQAVDHEHAATGTRVMKIRCRGIDREHAGQMFFAARKQRRDDNEGNKREETNPNSHEPRCYTRPLKVSNVVPTSQDAVARAARGLQASGGKLVFTNGCFDLLHPGHIELLAKARRLGDALVVAINSDLSVRRLKGPGRPIFPDAERAETLAALEMVNYVCVFDEDTPLEAILRIRPDILVKGADWVDHIVGQPEVEGWGGTVVAIPLIAGKSTTGIIERVLHGSPRKTH